MNKDKRLNFEKLSRNSRIKLLPLLENGNVYRANLATCKAVFQVRNSEIRISMVYRSEKGDFKDLMDSLVKELDCNTIRFIAVEKEGKGSEYSKRLNQISPDDAKPLYEVLYGFHYEKVGGYSESEVTTLVGEWK